MITVTLHDEQSIAQAGGHAGKMSDIFYDSDARLFVGVVRHRIGRLMTTTPVSLEPGLQAVKVLASTINGWLIGPEMDVLYQMAQRIKADQAIVEIGSYCGRSTVCLGWGSRLGHRARVYAIDPHTGSDEHQHYMQGTVGSLPYFRASIQRADLESLVHELVMTSEAATSHVQEPVGLVFIDGDHELAHEDLCLWYDKVAPRGLFLFHDSVGGGWPRVETDIRRAVEAGLIRVLDHAGTITIAEKTEKGELP